MTLKNQHAVITGGATGIGLAITRALAGAGAKITIVSRNLDQSSIVANSMENVTAVALDITDADAVERVFAAMKPIDILVNNAGAAITAPLHKISTEQWNAMLAVNLTGTFLCTKAALVTMRAKGVGRIINIASIAGLKGSVYTAAYSAAKHGVIGMTRSLALELASTNITANSICPGFVDTEIVENAVAYITSKTGRTDTEALAELVANNPQKRLIQPEEVATTALWLCDPNSGSINGQSIAIDGGETM